METKKILIVEDEYLTCADLKNCLDSMGYTVPGTADNGASAIQMAGDLKPDLVLMDITLKGEMTGIEAAGRIRDRFGLPVVYMTGHTDEATVDKAMTADPFGYLVKPIDVRKLEITLRMALLKHAIEARLRRSERTTRALLNAVPDALMLLDDCRKVIAINDTMVQKLGRSCDSIMGVAVDDLAESGAFGISRGNLDDLYLRGIPVQNTAKQGDRWFETSMHPITGSYGRIELVAVQCRDITGVKHLEEALKRDGLAQIEHNMEQFQILNDQIRNPLQAIKGYLALAEFEYADKIDEQIRRIDDIVTRLDTGWLESEKVRSFLFRHYQHGIQIPKQQPGDVMCR